MKASVSLRSPLPYLNNRSFRNLWSIQNVAVALLVTTTTSWLAYGEENCVWKRRRPRCLHYLLSEAAACWGIKSATKHPTKRWRSSRNSISNGSAEKISGRHHSSDDDTISWVSSGQKQKAPRNIQQMSMWPPRNSIHNWNFCLCIILIAIFWFSFTITKGIRKVTHQFVFSNNDPIEDFLVADTLMGR
jgi:hypothetical protein